MVTQFFHHLLLLFFCTSQQQVRISTSSRSAGDLISGVVEEENPTAEMSGISLKEFSFKDLKIATRNFGPDSLLGEGDYGRVYKGWVDEKTLAPSRCGIGMAVAIKILNPTQMRGFHEWQSEVNFLGRHYHPNVIGLFGYCWEDGKLVLVYEFMHKGSLEHHLFHSSIPLSWDIRFKVAIGAARGLAFLHNLEKKIIYRDFRASNILLDENYNAILSDFSLVTFGPSSEDSHISTNIIGTYGYADPEYIATGHLWVKSDVYGYGIMLLELVTGLRAVDINRPREQQNLVDWLKPMLSQRNMLRIIMDVRMDGQYSSEAAFQAAQLILKSLDLDPKRRPSIKQVVEVLKEIEILKDETK